MTSELGEYFLHVILYLILTPGESTRIKYTTETMYQNHIFKREVRVQLNHTLRKIKVKS